MNFQDTLPAVQQGPVECIGYDRESFAAGWQSAMNAAYAELKRIDAAERLPEQVELFKNCRRALRQFERDGSHPYNAQSMRATASVAMREARRLQKLL